MRIVDFTFPFPPICFSTDRWLDRMPPPIPAPRCAPSHAPAGSRPSIVHGGPLPANVVLLRRSLVQAREALDDDRVGVVEGGHAHPVPARGRLDDDDLAAVVDP